MSNPNKLCSNCINALLKDYGYSNYTVMGTNLICSNHPKTEFDIWYNKAPELDFAKECIAYTYGEPDHQCVDDD